MNQTSFTFNSRPSAGSQPKMSRRAPSPEDADLRVALLVLLRQEAPAGEREGDELGVPVRDAGDLRLALSSPAPHAPGVHPHPRAREGDPRDGLLDPRRVAERDADRLPPDLLQLVGAELLRPHEEVRDPHPPDHLERLPLGARADREHRDDRPDAEDHPEHREDGAELVRREALEGAQERLAEAHDAPPTGLDGAAGDGSGRRAAPPGRRGRRRPPRRGPRPPRPARGPRCRA